MQLQLSVPQGSIDNYISVINQVPMLTLEEERSLAERLQQDGDLEAARQLVMSHLRFVVRVAKGYSGYGLPLSDLIQEGSIGLMKAVKRFDPTVGVRLVSFAVHWIRAEMHEYIIKNWKIVKIATTKAQRKLFFNLRSSKKRLGWLNSEEINAVAEDLGVTPKDVIEMEKRLSSNDASFDLNPAADEDDNTFTPAAYLEDNSATPEEQVAEAQEGDLNQLRLGNALATLDERSQDIIRQRWLVEKKATLHELADIYDVSAERIRQLEAAALKKLQQTMN